MPGYAPAAWGAGPGGNGSGAAPGAEQGLDGNGLDGSGADRPAAAGAAAGVGTAESLSGRSGRGTMIWWSAVGVFVALIVIAVVARNFDLTAMMG
jgi:hypothetical protein